MKRVILDENLPVDLRLLLAEFSVVTVLYQGWTGVQNGELIGLIEGKFEVFITGDKKLRYQQNLAHRSIAIIKVPSTRLAELEEYLDDIRAAISSSQPGSYTRLEKHLSR